MGGIKQIQKKNLKKKKKKKSGKNVAHLSESEEDGVDKKQRKKEWDLLILFRGGTLMVGNTGRLPGSFIVQPGCIIPSLLV